MEPGKVLRAEGPLQSAVKLRGRPCAGARDRTAAAQPTCSWNAGGRCELLCCCSPMY